MNKSNASLFRVRHNLFSFEGKKPGKKGAKVALLSLFASFG